MKKEQIPSTAMTQKKATPEVPALNSIGLPATAIPDDIARNTYTRDRPIGLHVRVLQDKQKVS